MKNKFIFFLDFIQNPKSSYRKDDFFYLLEGALLLLFPSILIYNFFLFYFMRENENILIWNSIDMNFKIFLYITLISPLFEEFIFRLSLVGKRNLIISSILSLGYIVLRYLYFGKIGRFEVIFGCLSIIFLVLFLMKNDYAKFKFYFLNLVFALLHIINFELSVKYIGLYFLVVLNFIIIGLILSYYRMYYGFKANVAMHIIYNLSTILYILIGSTQQ